MIARILEGIGAGMPMARGRVSKVLAVLVVGGTAGIFLSGCSEEKPAPLPPRSVVTVVVDPKPLHLEGQGSGTVQARYVNNIGFLVSGRVLTRNVDIGDAVKQGDLLATIDPVDFESKLTSAQSEVDNAQAALNQASGEESRFKQLLANGFTSQARYDQALKDLQAARAGMMGAQADLKLAQDQLGYTTLKAPTDGVVTKVGANVGQVVQAGEMVVQLSSFEARDGVFAVSVLNIALAKVGMDVNVWLQARPEIRTEGQVREIAPNADPITGTYTVKVTLDDAPPEMFIGAVVVGEVSLEGGVVITLPSTAILQTGDDPAVWVVSESDGTVRKVPVTVGQFDSKTVTVKAGLKAGDRVVTVGVNSLAEGQKVAIEQAGTQ
jgi:RND family efflux transporter MFP subunit